MNDLMVIALMMLGTYLGSVGFAIILFKVFFPLTTQKELERLKLARNRVTISPLGNLGTVSVAISSVQR